MFPLLLVFICRSLHSVALCLEFDSTFPAGISTALCGLPLHSLRCVYKGAASNSSGEPFLRVCGLCCLQLTWRRVMMRTPIVCVVCRRPAGEDKFMICCDCYHDWYHGDCVGISPSQGPRLSGNNSDYVCLLCLPSSNNQFLH